MTELEIRILISEQSSQVLLCAQIWLAITGVLILVAYLAGNNLKPGLRKLIVFLYLVFAMAPVANWGVAYNDIQLLTNLLHAGNPSYTLPYEIILVGRTFAIVQLLGFFVGTIGALYYFHSTKRAEFA